MNVILIGFKSCGKSTVGRLLADSRDLDFVDLDDVILELICKQCGTALSCRDFYRTRGADAFRHVETEAVERVGNRDNMVLATGGGAPMTPANREEFAGLGTVCYINTSPELLFERMKQNSMPAYLADDPTLANLQGIWAKRDVVYQELADITIDAGEKSPEQITDEINQALA